MVLISVLNWSCSTGVADGGNTSDIGNAIAGKIIDKSGNQPFFIYMAHKDPHQPCFPSDDFAELSEIARQILVARVVTNASDEDFPANNNNFNYYENN